MGHLAIVSNLLTSLGAAPHFDRPNFPQSCVYYPPDYRLELLPFSDVTIERFVHLERPEGASWEGRDERPTRAFLPGCALAIPPRTREREDREEAHAASSRHHLSA